MKTFYPNKVILYDGRNAMVFCRKETEMGRDNLVEISEQKSAPAKADKRRRKFPRYKDPYRAALEAGYVRIRPVLMTALAMIIGMVPMALGLGEGGEQNAPLGRAVIGGLIFATAATLFLVPAIFMLVNKVKRVGTQDVAAETALG